MPLAPTDKFRIAAGAAFVVAGLAMAGPGTARAIGALSVAFDDEASPAAKSVARESWYHGGNEVGTGGLMLLAGGLFWRRWKKQAPVKPG